MPNNEITSKEAYNYILNNRNAYLANISEKEFFCNISNIEETKAQDLIENMFNSNNAKNTKQKGDSLETLVNYLLNNSGMFQRLVPNINFNYCQVDHYGVFKPEVWGMLFGAHKDFKNETNAFLGESKRYGQTLGVTYVLKFECVKHLRDIKFGVYFTRQGITGKYYSDAQAVIKRLYDKDKQFSIVFKDEDWNKVKDNPKSFGYLFCEKIFNFLDREQI